MLDDMLKDLMILGFYRMKGDGTEKIYIWGDMFTNLKKRSMKMSESAD